MIQIDTREQNNMHIIRYFDNMGIDYFSAKLDFGDYANPLKKEQIVIERKKNLIEFAGNCGKDHLRFKNELIRAKENDYKIIVLVEEKIKYEDLIYWTNPREKKKTRLLKDGTVKLVHGMDGDKMYKICEKWKEEYPLEIIFCDKKETPVIISFLLKE